MKLYFALVLAFTSSLLFGQTPYENHFGSTESDTGYSISPAVDGNGSMTVGVTYGFGAKGADILLLRQDRSGNKIWAKSLGSAEDESVKSVVTTSDGNYVMAGYRTTAGKGKDLLIIKFDDNGDTIWQKQLGGVGDDEVLSIVERSYDPGSGIDVTYLVTGYVTNTFGNKDIFYLELNTDGSKRLFTNYGTASDDIGTGITVVPGIYDPIIGGYSNGYDVATGNDIVVLFLGASGIIANVRRYTRDGEDKAYGIMVDPTSTSASFKISIAGSTNSFSTNGDLDAFLMFTLNQSQSNGLCKTYGNELDDEAFSVQSQGGSGFTFTGYHTDVLSGNKEGMQIFTDHGANNEGSRGTYACSGDEIIYDLVNINDTLFTTGMSNSLTNGGSDIFSNGFIGLFAGGQTFCNHQSYTPPQNDEFFLPRNEFANTFSADFTSSTDVAVPLLSETTISDSVRSACTEDIGADCNFTLSEDTTSCSSSINLFVDLPPCTTIQWSTGETSDTLTVTESGTYSFTTSGSCSTTDTIIVDLPLGNIVTYDDWHFGSGARIDFSSGIPISGNGITNGSNSFATISFKGETYITNGTRIVNSSGTTIPNGDGIEIGNSVSQPALFLTPPNSTNLVALYSINASGELKISTIDFTSSAKVTSKNTLLLALCTGKMAAIQTDSKSWIIVNTILGLKSFSINNDGSLTDADETFPPSDNISNPGILKVSPFGNKVCMVIPSTNRMFIADFNNVNGIFSNIIQITGISGSPQGVEFSPSENKIYVTCPGASLIYQFDLLDSDIPNSKTEIQPSADNYEYLELGPDGKIYISQSGVNASKMSVIENPDANSSNLSFSKNGLDLGLGSGNVSLVNYPRVVSEESNLTISTTGFCANSPTSISIKESFTGNVYWDFGDTTVIGDTSIQKSPSYSYSQPGTYTITLVNDKSCNITNSYYSNIKIVEGPPFQISDTTSCTTPNIEIDIPISADSMRWSNNETTSPQSFTASGTKFLTAWAEGCAYTDTFEITIGSGTTFTNFNSGQKSKRGNIWYFGLGAGINFNTSPPTKLENGQTDKEEGTSVIADEDGNLLFYTDGVDVWNKNHNVMPNGSGLDGHWSATQSGVIVPYPGNENLYYIFTVPAKDGNGSGTGMKYSIVDITLDGGKGDIIEKNTLLFSPSAEKITATVHANKSSIWVLGHDYPGNTFYAYLIDQNGLNPTPVTTSIGLSQGAAVSYVGYMKFSPNGKWLAHAIGPSGNELFKFNSATGIVSDALNIGSVGNRNYGLEFSPNSTKLYISSYFSNLIVQWDLSGSSTAEILASKTTIHNEPPNKDAIQLGPDGRLYIAKRGVNSLDIIENPDADAVDIIYTIGGISTGSGEPRNGLPTFITSLFINSGSAIGIDCSGEETELFIDTSADVVGWNFGDPSSGPGNTAGGESRVSHDFTSTGEFIIEVTYNDACIGETTLSTTLDIQSITIDTSFIDTAVCAENIVLDAENSTADFTWTNQPTGTTIGQEQTQTISESGDYRVTISNGSCTETIDYDVLLGPAINLDNLPDSSFICIENNEEVTLDPLLDATVNSYTWSVTSDDGRPLVVSDTGAYTIIATFDTICSASKTVYVFNGCEPVVLVPKAFTPNNDLLNDELEVFTYNTTSIEFTILNEWGEVVFHSDDFTTFWDGNYLNEPSMTSTYAWIAKYKGLVEGVEQEFQKVGEVTLIR